MTPSAKGAAGGHRYDEADAGPVAAGKDIEAAQSADHQKHPAPTMSLS
jgi:hypothetical protein